MKMLKERWYEGFVQNLNQELLKNFVGVTLGPTTLTGGPRLLSSPFRKRGKRPFPADPGLSELS